MRILMLSWEYPPKIIGGISRVVYHLAKELAACGDHVTVITVNDEKDETEEFSDGVRVFRMPPTMVEPLNFSDGILQMNFMFIAKAVSLCREEAFDIIHLHDWLVAYAGYVLKKSFPGIRVVCTIHSTEYGRNNGIHNSFQSYINNVELALAGLAHMVIGNSEYMKQEIYNQFGVPMDAICVIPNGVDIHKFDGIACSMEARRQFAADHEKLVMFVGRLVSEKGIYVLLEAIPRVLSVCPDTRFVIAGQGPELDNLRERSFRLCINEKLCLPGFIAEERLLELYKCADMAVFPSLYEPFGIVALEGMVAGIPVVVSDTGGLHQIVEHRVNGMKFETGNSGLLSECIIELLTDNALVETITKNALETVHMHYRWDNIAEKTHEAYVQTIRDSGN